MIGALGEEGITLPGGQDVVLLIHGLTGSPHELKYLAQKLNEAGFTVVVPYLAGHGTSLADLKTKSWTDWYETVRLKLLRLDGSYRHIYVGGLCMGAVLALLLAHDYPERVKALSLMSTTLKYDGWSLPWYSFMLPLAYCPPFLYCYYFPESEPYGVKDERLRRIIVRGLTNNNVAYDRVPAVSMRELYRLANKVKKLLPAIKTPTLLLHAQEDDLASLKNAEYVERHIGTSVLKKLVLDDSYHMIVVDSQRDVVASETVGFFSKH